MMNHPQASALRPFIWPKSLVLLLGFLLPSTYAIDTPLRDLSNPGRQTSAPSTEQAAYSIPTWWPPWLADDHSAGWRSADARGCENGTNMHAGRTVPESEEARFWQAPLYLVNGLDQCITQEAYAKRIDGPSFQHLPDRPVTTTPSSAKVQLTGLTQHLQVDPAVWLEILL
jgi:hypothetical protein